MMNNYKLQKGNLEFLLSSQEEAVFSLHCREKIVRKQVKPLCVWAFFPSFPWKRMSSRRRFENFLFQTQILFLVKFKV